MEILRDGAVPVVRMEGSGEYREYYQSSQHGFRIVVTHFPAGHVQNEHRHNYLLDITYVLEGAVQAIERREGILSEVTLNSGDLVCFAPPLFHNIANRGNAPARTLTLKMLRDRSISSEKFERLLEDDWIGYDAS
jgi:quercetin dioxygenase-like cupin family protein